MHLLLGRHLLDRLVIDLVHRVVGQGGLAGILQQRLHQHLVALEVDAVLDVVAIADLLLVGGLRQDDDVGEISDEVFAFLIGRHLRHAGADLILGEREVALADIDAIDAGDERIGILRRVTTAGATRNAASANAPSARASGRVEAINTILWRGGASPGCCRVSDA